MIQEFKRDRGEAAVICAESEAPSTGGNYE